MLKVFRDNLKNLAWILWVIIILFVLALAADFGASVRGRGNDTTAATVGREHVSMNEVKQANQRLMDTYRQMYGDQFPPELEKQVTLQALNQLVTQKILLIEARRMGLTVSDAELRERILEIFKDESGNFVGEQLYTQILQDRYQVTAREFERSIRDEMLTKKLADALTANLYVSEDEIQRAYRDQVERVKIRYVLLPRARFEPQVQVSPAEVEAYFKAHTQEFRLPEQRDLGYLLVNGSALADQTQVSDGELRAYYDSHKPEFTSEEQVKARHILVMVNDQRDDAAAQARIQEAKKKIEGGADFAAVAREYSDDTASKAQGGDLGYFGRNHMVKEFEDAAFSAQPGKLVGPVKSSFGYHLIEVTDKRPGGLQPFETVAPQIRARLTAERSRQLAETRAKEIASKLAANKPANADAVKALAQPPAVTWLESGRVGAMDPVPGLGTTLNTTAFAMKKGEVSQAVQVPQGWAIVYVKDVIPAHAPTLQEVEPRVRAAVTSQKLQQLTQQKLQQARQEIAQGKTLDQVAAELGVQVQESAEFGGQGAIPGLGYNPELAKAALALQTGQVGGPVSSAQGELLFQVTDHKGWDPKQYAANREQTRSTLLQQKANTLVGTLLEQRRRELNVEYNRQWLDQNGIAVPQAG